MLMKVFALFVCSASALQLNAAAQGRRAAIGTAAAAAVSLVPQLANAAEPKAKAYGNIRPGVYSDLLSVGVGLAATVGLVGAGLSAALDYDAEEACIIFEGDQVCGKVNPGSEEDDMTCVLDGSRGWVCA